MAAVTTSVILSSALQSNNQNQVWLDQDLGLVVGTFPSPTAKYDFASEQFVSVASGGDHSSKQVEPRPESLRRDNEFVDMVGQAERYRGTYDLSIAGTTYRVGSLRQAMVVGMEKIEAARPGTMEKLSGYSKRTKFFVSRNRSKLYGTPHPDSHSEWLECGYFVATNNNTDEVRGALYRAAELAGLEAFSFQWLGH